MALLTILPVLDLAVADSYNDMNSLSIVDLSQYASFPDSDHLALQITIPGYPTINVPFTPGSVNVYKCIDLGVVCATPDCCPLPDGVYDIKYTVLPTTPVIIGSASNINATLPTFIEKTFMRIDQLRCKWMNAFLKVDLECGCGDAEQKGFKEELKRIDLLMAGCMAAANNCDDALAYKLYQKADSMLNLICCKFNMPCGTIACNSCGCN